MTAFKKTILGRILGGVAKVVKPVAGIAGAVLGIGAVSGVIKGVGAVAGITGAAKTSTGIIGKVAQSAVNLVTGTTKAERDQVAEVKADAKAAQDKIDQVQRLMNAGASQDEAMKMVGITYAELGAANSEEKDKNLETTQLLTTPAAMKTAGQGCMLIALALLSSGVMLTVVLIIEIVKSIF